MTDAMSLGNINGLSRAAPYIIESLSMLGTQHNVSLSVCLDKTKTVSAVDSTFISKAGFILSQ